MTKLYIANCSKREHLFTWMIPENPKAFSHKLRAGTQFLIERTDDEVNFIIKQHEIYGMMEVSKVTKGFGGQCYRIGKPISIEAIEAGISQSDQEMIDRAQEARSITTAAQDDIISKTAQEMGIKQKGGIEFEVIEEKKNAADNDEKFEQKIEVIHEGIAPRGRSRAKK